MVLYRLIGRGGPGRSGGLAGPHRQLETVAARRKISTGGTERRCYIASLAQSVQVHAEL